MNPANQLFERFAVFFVLGTWIALSIVNQALLLFDRANGLERDRLPFMPRWLFWADPPSDEVVILYRDKFIDGRLTPWWTGWAMTSSSFQWVWNPRLREWGVLNHAWGSLIQQCWKGTLSVDGILLNWLYIATALHISSQAPHECGKSRQFAITKVQQYDKIETAPQILFVSPFFSKEAIT